MINIAKHIANKVQQHQSRISQLKANNQRIPQLVIFQVGNQTASNVYISKKINLCREIGILCEHIQLPATTSQKQLITNIQHFNNDDKVDGIIVQLPLPSHIDEYSAINSVDVHKDVDGLTALNLGKLALGSSDGFHSGALSSIKNLLNSFQQKWVGKTAVVIGQSNIVGKPVVNWLINQGMTVISCNKFTPNLGFYTQQGDVVITAAGVRNLITAAMVKPQVIILDVGTSYQHNKVYGDVLWDDAIKNKASYISPVPGGVGRLTVLNLINNVMLAYHKAVKDC